MVNVKEWRNGKLMLTVLIAEEAAGAAPSCHELLNSWRACSGFSELLSKSGEKEWLRLYTGHGRLQSGVVDAFCPFLPCMPSGDEASLLSREMVRMQSNGVEYATLRYAVHEPHVFKDSEGDLKVCPVLFKEVGRGDITPLLDRPELSEGGRV